MRKVVAWVLSFWSGVVALTAAEAVQTSRPNSVAAFVYDVGGGYALRTRTNIQIFALGYEFPVTGYSTGVVTVVNSTGTTLLSAAISTNSPALGKFHYEAVPPLVITAGTSLFVLGNNYDLQTPFFDALWVGAEINTNDFSVSQDFDYLGAAAGTNSWTGRQGVMLQGVNFQYTGYPTPPQLQIAITPTNILLSWPTSALDFTLQTSATLDGSMTNLNLAPTIQSGMNTLPLPRNDSQQYFRLSY